MLPSEARSGLLDRALAPLAGLLVGGGAGGAMQLWLGATHLSVATFIMCSYTAGILVIAHRAAKYDHVHRKLLSRLPINRPHRRIFRMLIDPLAWWSLAFGLSCVVGAAWWGGISDPSRLGLVALAWFMVNVLLSYELTLLHPTTRCRKCDYQLVSLLDPTDRTQIVKCPECGSQWSKADLCLVPMGVVVEPRISGQTAHSSAAMKHAEKTAA